MMSEILPYIIIFAVFFLWLILPPLIAKSHGRSWERWLLISMVLPIISIVLLAILPRPTKITQKPQSDLNNTEDGEEKIEEEPVAMDTPDEVLDFMEAVSNKIMETGILTQYIEEGSLSLVSLSISGDKDSFEIIVKLSIDDRDDSELTDDEWDYITERVNVYFSEKQLWPELEAFGYKESNSDGFDVVVES